MMIITMRSAARLALLAGLTLGLTSVMAEVLYKLVGKNGKVVYSDSVPENFDGQVARLEIDSAANTMAGAPIGRAGKGARTETQSERSVPKRPPSNEDAIQAARLNLQSAQAAFENAQENSTAEDWQFTRNGRRFPKPEYAARLTRLEQNVKLAEEALQKLEHAL